MVDYLTGLGAKKDNCAGCTNIYLEYKKGKKLNVPVLLRKRGPIGIEIKLERQTAARTKRERESNVASSRSVTQLAAAARILKQGFLRLQMVSGTGVIERGKALSSSFLRPQNVAALNRFSQYFFRIRKSTSQNGIEKILIGERGLSKKHEKVKQSIASKK